MKEVDDIEGLQTRWQSLQSKLQKDFEKEVTVEGILFLIGIRELGILPREFEKEEKQDLMSIAICAILAPSGFYKLEGKDKDGWPIWKQIEELPFIDIFSQEVFLKSHIVDYFSDIYEL